MKIKHVAVMFLVCVLLGSIWNGFVSGFIPEGTASAQKTERQNYNYTDMTYFELMEKNAAESENMHCEFVSGSGDDISQEGVSCAYSDDYERPEEPFCSVSLDNFECREFVYDGKPLSFTLTIKSNTDYKAAVGLYADGKLVPVSVDGGEYEYCSIVQMNPDVTLNNFTVSFEPCAKKGETVTVYPIVIRNVGCTAEEIENGEEYNFARLTYTTSTNFVKINTDCGALPAPAKVWDAASEPIAENIAEFYNGADYSNAENKDYVDYRLEEENFILEIPDFDPYAEFENDCGSVKTDASGTAKLPVAVVGRKGEVTLICYADGEFIPVSDGKTVLTVTSEGADKMTVCDLKLDLSGHPDAEYVRLYGFYSWGTGIKSIEGNILVVDKNEQ